MFQPPQRVLSGIQPSGSKHLGNYFGAIAQFLRMQDEFPGECFIFIADYHALTTLHDAAELRKSVFELAKIYLALGLDPDKALLFRQSDVPEVTELAWLLATVTGMGLLQRATSYKDKVDKGITPNVGLFTYPLLMAADILIYDSTLVPVGKDRIQHVEMAQDMATHFNQTYGQEVLRRPEHRMSRNPLVPGTDGEKMSTSYGNTIPIFESGKALKNIVNRKIVTDARERGTPIDPDGCKVFALTRLFAGDDELERIAGYYRTGQRDGQPFGYGDAKAILIDHIERFFAPGRANMERYAAEPQLVEDVLARSARRARAVAQATLLRCKQVCGLA